MYDDTHERVYTDENGNEVTELTPFFGVISLDEVKEDRILLKIRESRFFTDTWMLVESFEVKIGESVEIQTGMMDYSFAITFKYE